MFRHLCKVWGHRRSRAKARPFAATWRSECRRCGQRMERVSANRWQSLPHQPMFWMVSDDAGSGKIARLVSRLAGTSR